MLSDDYHDYRKKTKGISIRVLSLASYPPFLTCPPMSGGAMHIIKPLTYLGDKGNYQISVLFPAASPTHTKQVCAYFEGRRGFQDVIGVVCKKDLINTDRRDQVPDGALHLYGSPCYLEALKRVLGKETYDIVVLETSYMAWTIPLIRRMQPNARIVLDLQNAEHIIMWRMAQSGGLTEKDRKRYLLEYRKTFSWEKQFWPAVDFCMAVSPLEAQLFNRYAPGVPVRTVVAGGGVNTKDIPRQGGPQEISTIDIAFVGTMWYPNIHGLLWFINKVFPVVKAQFSQTKLHIIGSGKPSGMLLNAVSGRREIIFWGQQRDERDILAGSGVFVVPLFIGAGTRIKIMNAWSLGLPVISTSIGAEGLHCKHGTDIIIADGHEEFAMWIINLLTKPVLRKRLAYNGKKTVKKFYSESVAAEKVTGFFEVVMKDL